MRVAPRFFPRAQRAPLKPAATAPFFSGMEKRSPRAAMESTEVLELHRNVRTAVGYKGKQPSEEKLNLALCAVKAAHRATKTENSNAVEISILFFGGVVAMLLCWYTVKRYYSEDKGTALGACARVTAIVLGLELLILVFFGGIRDKKATNDRISDQLFPELFDLDGGLRVKCGRRTSDPLPSRGRARRRSRPRRRVSCRGWRKPARRPG